MHFNPQRGQTFTHYAKLLKILQAYAPQPSCDEATEMCNKTMERKFCQFSDKLKNLLGQIFLRFVGLVQDIYFNFRSSFAM